VTNDTGFDLVRAQEVKEQEAVGDVVQYAGTTTGVLGVLGAAGWLMYKDVLPGYLDTHGGHLAWFGASIVTLIVAGWLRVSLDGLVRAVLRLSRVRRAAWLLIAIPVSTRVPTAQPHRPYAPLGLPAGLDRPLDDGETSGGEPQ
jgi:hypothetical protein